MPNDEERKPLKQVRSYRTDAGEDPIKKLFGSFLRTDGQEWALQELPNEAGFTLIVQDSGVSKNFQGWVLTKEQLSNFWEMLSEALHPEVFVEVSDE